MSRTDLMSLTALGCLVSVWSTFWPPQLSAAYCVLYAAGVIWVWRKVIWPEREDDTPIDVDEDGEDATKDGEE